MLYSLFNWVVTSFKIVFFKACPVFHCFHSLTLGSRGGQVLYTAHPCLWTFCSPAKSLQSCPTLCDPMGCSRPGFSAHGILQVRILEWVAIPFSRGSFWPREWTCVFYVSCIGRQLLYHSHHLGRLLLSWDSPGKNTGVGGHFLRQGTFPTQGSNPCLLHTQAGSLPLSHQGSPFSSPRQYFSGCCCGRWPQGDSICSLPAVVALASCQSLRACPALGLEITV